MVLLPEDAESESRRGNTRAYVGSTGVSNFMPSMHSPLAMIFSIWVSDGFGKVRFSYCTRRAFADTSSRGLIAYERFAEAKCVLTSWSNAHVGADVEFGSLQLMDGLVETLVVVVMMGSNRMLIWDVSNQVVFRHDQQSGELACKSLHWKSQGLSTCMLAYVCLHARPSIWRSQLEAAAIDLAGIEHVCVCVYVCMNACMHGLKSWQLHWRLRHLESQG